MFKVLNTSLLNIKYVLDNNIIGIDNSNAFGFFAFSFIILIVIINNGIVNKIPEKPIL